MEKLKELRLNSNLTQKNIADQLGCNQTAFGKYERGELEPNIDTLIKLSKIFNCSVDYLIGNENEYDIIQSSSAPTLTKTQSELLSVFNLLSEEDQHQVIGFAKALAY